MDFLNLKPGQNARFAPSLNFPTRTGMTLAMSASWPTSHTASVWRLASRIHNQTPTAQATNTPAGITTDMRVSVPDDLDVGRLDVRVRLDRCDLDLFTRDGCQPFVFQAVLRDGRRVRVEVVYEAQIELPSAQSAGAEAAP